MSQIQAFKCLNSACKHVRAESCPCYIRSSCTEVTHLQSAAGASAGSNTLGVAGSGLGCSGDAIGTGLGNGLQGLGLPKSDAGKPGACCASQERHRRMRRLPLHFCALGSPGRRPKHLARSCSNSDVRRPASVVGRGSSANVSVCMSEDVRQGIACRRWNACAPHRVQAHSLGSLSGTGLWKGSSHGAQRLCLAASTAPVARLTAHSTAAQVVTHAGSGGSAHLSW